MDVNIYNLPQVLDINNVQELYQKVNSIFMSPDLQEIKASEVTHLGTAAAQILLAASIYAKVLQRELIFDSPSLIFKEALSDLGILSYFTLRGSNE